MDWNYDEEKDEGDLVRQRDIEAAEVADVEEMFATMKEKGLKIGKGFYIPDFAAMHIESINAGDRFYCEPREKDLDPLDVPPGHPFRAILGVLHAAEKKLVPGDLKTIRLYAYCLSCPYLVDTLIHYRKFFDLRVIIHPKAHSLKMIKKFIDNIPPTEQTGNPRTGLEMIEFRVADFSHKQTDTSSMHRKELITEDFMVFGSYNYSLAARCYNWETIIVADTRQDDVFRFDAFWEDLAGRVLKIYNPDANFFPPQEQKALLEYMKSLPPVPQTKVANPYKKVKAAGQH